MELCDVLETFEPAELRIIHAHDGFRIYLDEGESNIGDELLWKWDSTRDGPPIEEMTVLFEQIGCTVS